MIGLADLRANSRVAANSDNGSHDTDMSVASANELAHQPQNRHEAQVAGRMSPLSGWQAPETVVSDGSDIAGSKY